MAEHKVITSDAEIDQALASAKALAGEPRVSVAKYDARLDVIALKLSDGKRVFIPREELEGLENADRRQLEEIEILGNGTGLHWPALDVDFYVPALLRGVFGSKRWLARIGSKGGSVKSPAKAEAARTNGLRGGRPKTATTEPEFAHKSELARQITQDNEPALRRLANS